jgi:heat-inducible transcriptional repressor
MSPRESELSPRRQRILRRIVEEYVATAQPVASDLIARKYEPDVSSATVRNEMGILEELGLIMQPHTSAGRVPTDRGYRVFVERIMEDRTVAPAEQHTIRHQFHQVSGSPGESAHLASSVLARALCSAAVATQPANPKARLLRLELVPLHDEVVLVTLILQSGVVRQEVVHLEQPVSRGDLTRLSNELSDRFANKTAGQARRATARLTTEARPFATVTIRLLQQAEEHEFAAIYYEGLTQLLSQPEFAQSQKLRPILEVLEQQPLLARFLAESLALPGSTQVIIGAENRFEQMRETSVILQRYGSADDVWGVVGVVGPTRLPYWRAVPMVRFMSNLMEVLVHHSFGSAGPVAGAPTKE